MPGRTRKFVGGRSYEYHNDAHSGNDSDELDKGAHPSLNE
jgi:hypothetical protein